jgi:hypothetical protein
MDPGGRVTDGRSRSSGINSSFCPQSNSLSFVLSQTPQSPQSSREILVVGLIVASPSLSDQPRAGRLGAAVGAPWASGTCDVLGCAGAFCAACGGVLGGGWAGREVRRGAEEGGREGGRGEWASGAGAGRTRDGAPGVLALRPGGLVSDSGVRFVCTANRVVSDVRASFGSPAR